MQEKLFDLVKNNLKNPKLYALLLASMVIFFLLFPYLDANVFYYKRINDRVEILEKVSVLDSDLIAQNPTLKAEYERILVEISNQPESMVSSILTKETSKKATVAKFISGGFLFWVIAFWCFGIKEFKNVGYKILGFILFSIVGVLFGFIAKAIPTIFNPWVNCVGFPIILIIFIALLLTSNKKGTSTVTEQ